MSNLIKIKRNLVAGAIPLAQDLEEAEPALNLIDEVLYIKGPNGIFTIGQFSRLKNVGVQNVSYSAAPFELVGLDTTGNVVTVRLPDNPPLGAIVAVKDTVGQLATNPARVYATTNPVGGSVGGLVLNQNNLYMEFYFFDTTVGWIVTNQVTTLLAGTLADEAAWSQFEIDTWSTSQAQLGTENLTWGNI